MRAVDQDEGLLPIGMFSRASSLSIKALRAYHEGGILVPARVDPRPATAATPPTSWPTPPSSCGCGRWTCRSSRCGRCSGPAIPEVTRRILVEHRIGMEARLAATERIVAELQSGPAPTTHTPVHVRTEPAVDTVRIVAEVPDVDLWAFLDDAFARLRAVLTPPASAAVGPPSALYPPEIAEEGAEHVEAFLAVGSPVPLTGRPPCGGRRPAVGLGEVPAGPVAVLVHAGSYDTIGDTYRTLGAWVARHARHAGDRRPRAVRASARPTSPRPRTTGPRSPGRSSTGRARPPIRRRDHGP